jgi:hypothetical protein
MSWWEHYSDKELVATIQESLKDYFNPYDEETRSDFLETIEMAVAELRWRLNRQESEVDV